MPATSDRLREIVAELEVEHGGGRPYFTALDARVSAPEFFEELMRRYDRDFPAAEHRPTIVTTGQFGEAFRSWLTPAYRMIALPGGLTHANDRTIDGLVDRLHGQVGRRSVFMDDSLYSAGTWYSVVRALYRCGSVLAATYVVYDGSPRRDLGINSIYRYHA